MSVNKIIITQPLNGSQLPFHLQEGEVIFFKSPTARQSFSVKLKEPRVPVKVNISVANGQVFVTSHRFIFITKEQGDVESSSFDFSTGPICQFSHALKSPWFGPNYWLFMFFSPANSVCDGFPHGEWFEGQISFKDGGLFEFVASIDRAINDAVNNSHIDEELPRYSLI